MTIAFGARTDKGRRRERNEDNFLVDPNLSLVVVADGMGGHAAGSIASATAVNVVRESLLRSQAVFDGFGEETGRREVLQAIEHAIQRACFRIFERAKQIPHQKGMGTTVTLMLVVGGHAFIGHVGDSRLYLMRDGAIFQLTDDHSLVQEMMKSGRIRSATDFDPRYRNAVTRAVGVRETVEVDTLDFELLPGDRMLLCSDGLHGYATPEQLLDLIERAPDLDGAAESLIAHANKMGGADNITAVIADVGPLPEIDADRVRKRVETMRSLVLYRYLSYHELLRVLNITEERRVHAGEVVFSEGDIEACAYIILEGRVRIEKGNVIIAMLTAGSHFGEMALVENAGRSADAIAVEDCWLLLVRRRPFYEMMRQNPSLAVKLLWSLVKALTIRLKLTNNRLSLVKGLFHALNPEELDRLPEGWLNESEREPSPIPRAPARAKPGGEPPREEADA